VVRLQAERSEVLIPAVATDFLFSTKFQNGSGVYPTACKVKVKTHPRIVREDPEGKQRYSSTLSWTWVLDGSGLMPRPGRFNPRIENRYPLYRGMGGSQDRYKWVRKISTLPRFDPRTFQPVTSRYTYWFIPSHTQSLIQWVKGLFAWRDVNWSSGTEVKNERNCTSAPSYMPLRSLTGTTLPFYFTTGQSFQPSFMSILLSVALCVRKAQLVVEERNTSTLPV